MENVITEKRLAKFARVAALRQHMTVIIENVHDPHNIGAVMRTCDSVGIQELYVLYTETHLTEEKINDVHGSSTGVRKWLDVHFFKDVDKCFKAVRKKYDRIWATHLGTNSKKLYGIDLTGNVALLFGNEHQGLSSEALSYADGNYIIPQFGMVGSLNISVACAVSLYEAARQRDEKGMYQEVLPEIGPKRSLFESYQVEHNKRYKR